MEAAFGTILTTIAAVVLFYVAFGRQLSDRHFSSYDELKKENAAQKLRLDTLETKSDKLEDDLEDERKKTRAERKAKEEAEDGEKAAKEAERRARAEAETLKMEKAQINEDANRKLGEMQQKIDDFTAAQTQRDEEHAAALRAEKERADTNEREKLDAQRERDEIRQDRDKLRDELQTQINTLKDQINELKPINGNGHAAGSTTATASTYSSMTTTHAEAPPADPPPATPETPETPVTPPTNRKE